MSNCLSLVMYDNLLTSSSAPPYDASLKTGLPSSKIGGPSVVEEKV
jgi:hypothetical protein